MIFLASCFNVMRIFEKKRRSNYNFLLFFLTDSSFMKGFGGSDYHTRWYKKFLSFKWTYRLHGWDYRIDTYLKAQLLSRYIDVTDSLPPSGLFGEEAISDGFMAHFRVFIGF